MMFCYVVIVLSCSRSAALESREEISNLIGDAHMVGGKWL